MFDPTKGKLRVFANRNHWSACTIVLSKEFEIKSEQLSLINGKIHTITEPNNEENIFLFDNNKVYIFN